MILFPHRSEVRNASIAIIIAMVAFNARASEVVPLAENGRCAWHASSASLKTPGVAHAVAELRAYFARISGAELPLVKNVSSGSEIVVGLRTELSPEDKARLPPKKEGADGYAIVVIAQPPRIVIAGDNPRGTIYGVYDLLERLGCRWFYPAQDHKDPEVVPQLNKVELPVGAWAVASPIAARIFNGDAWFFKIDPEVAKKQVDWAMKNRYNVIGWQCMPSNQDKTPVQQYEDLRNAGVLEELEKRGMTLHGPAHSFDHFLNSTVYFEKHPEWFGMRGGKRVPQAAMGAQFCWSNVEARKEFVKNATEFIASAPLLHIFCTIPFDGGPACECDECKKSGASNLTMTLSGELIESVKKVRPDVVVEQVAGYGPLAEPPTDRRRIPPDLRFIWAQWGRNHAFGYSDPRYDAKNLEAWRAIAGGKLSICQYYGDSFSEPWIMGPFTVAIESDRRYFVEKHIDELYVLMYSKGYWWNHGFNMSLAGRMFYDVSLDPASEVRDYALHYFGPNAGPLLAKYYAEWAKNVEMPYRLRGGATRQDRELLAEERKRFITPAVAAAGHEAPYAYRVGKVATLHDLAERLAELERRHDAIVALRRDGKFQQATQHLREAKEAFAETMNHFYSAADLNAGLADRDETTAFIKLIMQTWLDAEAKAIATQKKS